MLQNLSPVDMAVVVILLLLIVAASMWSSFKKKDAEEYFMASRSLRWWSVAGSIFGTNIHAQQIIGMMGVGYSIGFAQSHYEVWAVPAILVVAYVFIPIYRKRNFFTLSQFLEKRYNPNARLVYTVLMITFIMIQLVGGFYIGSRTLGLLLDGTSFDPSYLQGIFAIATVTVVFTVFGGMESVVIADNILTVIMIIAVLLIGTLTYLQPEIGGLSGLLKLDHAEANKMHLYLPSNHPKLPWAGIFTGLTILNMFYWSTNQYQVQRVLAAKTDRDAKLGSIVAGFLKLIIPFFSIAAGTAAFYLFKSRFGTDVVKPDDTFLTLLKTVVPVGYGFVGLILAGLLCAIFSAIYSMMNSVSTMMAFDVYKKYINPQASDKMTVRFGQLFVVVMCGIAIFLANSTYDPNSSDNFFLILANQTSYIKPGLVIAFFWGVLWKKTNPKAAVIALVAAPFIGLTCDWLYANAFVKIDWVRDTFGEQFNFLYRVFMIFVLGSGLIYGLSKWFNRALQTHSSGVRVGNANQPTGVRVGNANQPTAVRVGNANQPTAVHVGNTNQPQPTSDTDELTVPLRGIGRTLAPFVLIHGVLLVLVLMAVLSPQVAATPAAVLTMGVFGWLLRKEEDQGSTFKWYESDIFYAGLLTTAMVWIMYFFA